MGKQRGVYWKFNAQSMAYVFNGTIIMNKCMPEMTISSYGKKWIKIFAQKKKKKNTIFLELCLGLLPLWL